MTEHQSPSLPDASTWALLASPFHASSLGPPYSHEIEAELSRRGWKRPIRVIADLLIGALLLPIRADITAWPDPDPPNARQVSFCAAVWLLALGLVSALTLLGTAIMWHPPQAVLAAVAVLGLSACPLAALLLWRQLHLRIAQRHRPKSTRDA